MAKKFVISVLCVVVSLLLLIVAAVFVFDPLYQYHLPRFGLPMPVFSERYQNAGLARHYDYDALLIGSSMMENNRASWYSEAFSCKALKLTFAGGYMPEYDMLLSTVYTVRSPRYVFLSLDLYAMICEPDYQFFTNPEYLYDDNRLNDIRYLLNKDVLLDFFPEYVAGCRNPEPLDDAYAFEDEREFGRDAALAAYEYERQASWSDTKLPADIYRANCAGALAYFTKHIAAHPETTFYVFLPPVSVLAWENYARAGRQDAVLGAIDEAVDVLLPYENVRLFCFAAMESVAADLDNYMDSIHFTPEINRLLMEEMAAGRWEMTADNRQDMLDALTDFVHNYDYAALGLPS